MSFLRNLILAALLTAGIHCGLSELDCQPGDPACSTEAAATLALLPAFGGSGAGQGGEENAGPEATRIYIFATSTPTNAALGDRSATTSNCAGERATNFPALICSNDLAFLSYTSDALVDAPANHGVPTGVPVLSPTDNAIDTDWVALFDGGIATSLNVAGVGMVTTSYWTGSAVDGQPGNRCLDWTDNGGVETGDAGLRTSTNGGWISNSADLCSSSKIYLCLCW